MKNLVNILNSTGDAVDKAHAEGIHVAGERYVVTRIEERSVYARQVRIQSRTGFFECCLTGSADEVLFLLNRVRPVSLSSRRSRPSWWDTTARTCKPEMRHRPSRRWQTTSSRSATRDWAQIPPAWDKIVHVRGRQRRLRGYEYCK